MHNALYMRYLGIDYGSKRVGIAVSDEEGKFALPNVVLPNNAKLLDELNTIICDNNVTTVILGESKNFKGEDNTIMNDIRHFKEKIENNLGKTVIFEPEFLTSHAAQRFQGKNDMHDASAAALILQSYLDRFNNKNI
jgi:putative holliday junction resolvase